MTRVLTLSALIVLDCIVGLVLGCFILCAAAIAIPCIPVLFCVGWLRAMFAATAERQPQPQGNLNYDDFR